MERLSGIFHLSFAHLTCKKQERTNSSSPLPALRCAFARSPSSARSHAAPSLLPPSLPRPAHSTGYLCKGLREANSRPPKTRRVHAVCFAFRNCQSQALALHFRRWRSLPSSFRHRNDCSSSEDGRTLPSSGKIALFARRDQTLRPERWKTARWGRRGCGPKISNFGDKRSRDSPLPPNPFRARGRAIWTCSSLSFSR